jgi:putative cell wall-binding protein
MPTLLDEQPHPDEQQHPEARRRPVATALGALLCAALLAALPGVASADHPPLADGGSPRVDRVAGADRITTAALASQIGWRSAQAAVVATAHAFPDALVGAPLAASVDGPLLLTHADQLPGEVAEELDRLGVSEVIVLGGVRAISSEVEESIAALPGRPRVTRLAGADRYGTAAEAARIVTTHGQPIAIASGTTFADAVSSGVLPGPSGRLPVLLATREVVPEGSREVIAELEPRGGVLVGGTAALSDAVAADLEAQIGEITRLAGPDRFATSRAVAESVLGDLGPEPRPLVVAAGSDYADALAAGGLAAHLDGVVLLAPRFRLTDGVETFVRAHRERWSRVLVVGGAVAVDDDVLAELVAAVTDAERPPPALHVVGTAAGYRGTARPLPEAVAQEMTGVSWRPGCPVGLDELALLDLRHRDDAGNRVPGELVVARSVAGDVLQVFARLHDSGVPVARMRRIDHYGGDDDASMDDDNTSAFNCRAVTGGSSWSEHAYGTAVDINPIRNPYVRGTTVLPAAGRAYTDRSDVRPGMAVRPGPIVEAFTEIGWGWGGDWRSTKDYMHFSASGR